MLKLLYINTLSRFAVSAAYGRSEPSTTKSTFRPSNSCKSIWKSLQEHNLTYYIGPDFNLRRLGTLTADLRCYDVFNTNKNGGIIYGIRELTVYNPARRTFSLDLTWKFNEARSKYRGSGAGDKQKSRM